MSSKIFLKQLETQDSVAVWFSQGYLCYNGTDSIVEPFSSRNGRVKIITRDSIFDFATSYGYSGSTSCNVSGDEVRTKDRIQKMEFSGNVMYLKSKENNQNYCFDTLEHIVVESYFLRKVSAQEIARLMTNKGRTFHEATLFGRSNTDWTTDEGTATYPFR